MPYRAMYSVYIHAPRNPLYTPGLDCHRPAWIQPPVCCPACVRGDMWPPTHTHCTGVLPGMQDSAIHPWAPTAWTLTFTVLHTELYLSCILSLKIFSFFFTSDDLFIVLAWCWYFVVSTYVPTRNKFQTPNTLASLCHLLIYDIY